jgi:hypothetical protein
MPRPLRHCWRIERVTSSYRSESLLITSFTPSVAGRWS